MIKHTRTGLFLLLAAFFLVGCDVSTPSQVNVTQIQVKEGMMTESMDAFHTTPEQIGIISEAYQRNNRGPLSLTMSYDAHDAQQEGAIRKQGEIYRQEFAKRGISHLNLAYVAMNNPAQAGKAIISYLSLRAEAPANCGRIPGYQGAEPMAEMEKYHIGCEMQAAVSQMIADPSDLMGKAGTAEGDSRRQGAAVEKYKAGTPNPKMNGINASAIGTGSGG